MHICDKSVPHRKELLSFPIPFAHFKKHALRALFFLKKAKASRCFQRLLCNSKLWPARRKSSDGSEAKKIDGIFGILPVFLNSIEIMVYFTVILFELPAEIASKLEWTPLYRDQKEQRDD